MLIFILSNKYTLMNYKIYILKTKGDKKGFSVMEDERFEGENFNSLLEAETEIKDRGDEFKTYTILPYVNRL